MDGRHGARKPSTLGRKTFREAKEEFQAENRGDPGAGSITREFPKGYGDELRWAMADEFIRQARANVYYMGVGVPYVYKALTEALTLSGLRRMDPKRWVYKGRQIRMYEVGIHLVRYFWNHAPWDRHGDILQQFTDQAMFDDCLAEMLAGWQRQRAHEQIQKKMQTYTPAVFHRVPGKSIGYKSRGVS